MNINSKNFVTQPAGVSSVSDPKLFDTFYDTDCSAAIWARDVPLYKQAWINGLERTVLPTGRVIIPTNLVTETVTNLFDISGLPRDINLTFEFFAAVCVAAINHHGRRQLGSLQLIARLCDAFGVVVGRFTAT